MEINMNTIMKLEDAVDPLCLDNSCRPTLHRHVLSHLLYLALKARPEGAISLKSINIANFYQKVAVDLLSIHGTVDKKSVASLSPAIARRVKNFDKTRQNLREKSSKAKHADFKRKLDEPFTVINEKCAVPVPIMESVDSGSSSASSSSTAYDREYPPLAYFSEDSTQSLPDLKSNDPDYVPEPMASEKKVNVTTYFKGNLDGIAAEFERSGIGKEAIARTLTLCNLELYKQGYIDKPVVFPRSRIEGSVARDGKRRVAELSERSPVAIFFDAKEDKNVRMSVRDKNGDIRSTIGKRNHYSVVEQPGAHLLGYFCPEQSTGIGIAVGLLNYLTERSIDHSNLSCLGGDNTSVNSGHSGGAFREFEVLLGRPLQRAFCLLHQVELPLRKMFVHYGGTTKAPGDFDGPIGKYLSMDLWTLPVRQNFKKLGCDFPRLSEEVLNQMSNDSQIMYHYCVGVETGKLGKIASRRIGPCSTARWITFGTRILRLYVSKVNHSAHVAEIVERLASFIVNVYYKVFANIKLKSKLTDGATHLYDQIRLSKEHCLPEERKVVQESIQQNSFMAHPESILVTMMGDEDAGVRKRAVNIIKGIRCSVAYDKFLQRQSGVRKPKKIRKFYCPRINFNCATYFNMIAWKTESIRGPGNPPERLMYLTSNGEWEPVAVPPLLENLTPIQIDQFLVEPFKCEIPCHSQSVEHAVALTSLVTKNRRTEETQLRSMLQVAAARRDFKGKVSHKRFKDLLKEGD